MQVVAPGVDPRSPAEIFAAWPQDKRRAYTKKLTAKQLRGLRWRWKFWARPKQRTPKGDWFFWLLKSGRGFGKTRTGAEFVREMVYKHAGDKEQPHFALVGRTVADVRDVMVKMLLRIFPPDEAPHYEPSKRLLTFHTGATATTYSADKPDQLRGPEHHYAWGDEVAAWRYIEAFDNLVMGLRLGRKPRCVLTTTPRPTKLVRSIIADPDAVVTSGSTYENRTNLAGATLRKLEEKYKGTRLGRQELDGEVIDGHPGALWAGELFERDGFYLRADQVPELEKIVVALDPSITDDGNHAGIICAGRCEDGFGYVLDDASLQASPNAWATAAVDLLKEREGDVIIAEANQGGDMITTIIEGIDPNVYVETVHAARGKRTRAEPVAAKYEQGKVHHVGAFPELEDEMVNWVPGMDSPDRMDAMVWAFTDLLLQPEVWIK